MNQYLHSINYENENTGSFDMNQIEESYTINQDLNKENIFPILLEDNLETLWAKSPNIEEIIIFKSNLCSKS